MREEANRPALPKASHSHGDIEKVLDGLYGIRVAARCGNVGRSEHICKQLVVSNLLLGEPLDEELIVRGYAHSFELFGRKLGEAKVEQVQFDELLILP